MNTIELTFTTNGNKNPIFYITVDPAQPKVNTLEITIKNTSAQDLVMQGGQSNIIVTPPNNAPPNVMFTAAEFNGVTAPTGWTVTPSSGQFPAWTLTPLQNVVIQQGGQLTVTVGNIKLSNQLLDGSASNWSFSWNIPTVQKQTVQRLVFTYNPPPPGLLDLEMLCDFSQEGPSVQVNNDGTYIQTQAIPGLNQARNAVFITQPETSSVLTALSVFLTNVQASITFIDSSQFIFYFVESNDASTDLGALASHDIIKQIAIQSFAPGAQQWATVPQSEQQGAIRWTYTPGLITLDTNSASTLKFNIQNIYTALPPYVTLLYIQYKNIPGYKNGVYPLPMQKILPAPVFASLTVNGKILPSTTVSPLLAANFPLPLDIGQNQQALLAWKTIGATGCSISPDRAPTVPGGINDSFPFIPYPISNPPGNGNITLGAAYQGGTPALRAMHFNLKPYEIDEFDAAVAGGARSNNIALDSYTTAVTLYWKTKYVQDLTITDDAGVALVSYHTPGDVDHINQGSAQTTVTRPNTVFTLTVDGYVMPPPAAAPVPPTPVTVTAPVPTISMTFTPTPGKESPGTITVTWDIPFVFDQVTVSANFSFNGQVICPIPATQITPLPPQTGNFTVPLATGMNPGTYSTDFTFAYSKNGFILATIQKNFTFTL
jgi:hypothetical protein